MSVTTQTSEGAVEVGGHYWDAQLRTFDALVTQPALDEFGLAPPTRLLEAGTKIVVCIEVSLECGV